MSIVLSHSTAKAVYRAAYSVSAIGVEPCSPAKIYGARPSKELLDSAADWLAKHNIAFDDGAPLETTVFERANVRNMPDCRCHVSSKRFSGSRFIELADDIYIVGVELCALQAATHLPFRELVEYYFELCSAYRLEAMLQHPIPNVSCSPRLRASSTSLTPSPTAVDSNLPEKPSGACETDAARRWKRRLS